MPREELSHPLQDWQMLAHAWVPSESVMSVPYGSISLFLSLLPSLLGPPSPSLAFITLGGVQGTMPGIKSLPSGLYAILQASLL